MNAAVDALLSVHLPGVMFAVPILALGFLWRQYQKAIEARIADLTGLVQRNTDVAKEQAAASNALAELIRLSLDRSRGGR